MLKEKHRTHQAGGGGRRCFRNCSNNHEVLPKYGLYIPAPSQRSEGFTSIPREGCHFHFDWGNPLREMIHLIKGNESSWWDKCPGSLPCTISIRLVQMDGSPACIVTSSIPTLGPSSDSIYSEPHVTGWEVSNQGLYLQPHPAKHF